MVRGLADAIVLFALPFVLFALLLLVQRRFRLLGPQWTQGRLALLSVAGLVLVLVALVLYGIMAPRPGGAYVPAHVEGGRVIPGRIQ